MCGIGGFLSLSDQSIPEAWLTRINHMQRHRGPNGHNLYLSPQRQIGFAHQRLSVLDLSTASDQPMHFQGCTLIFNGEIYNYLDIRKELETLGHTFISQGDSEVLLKAYFQWGERCLEYLNGMWAFAIWDERRNILFCSRDRFGIKPFYYCQSGPFFAFSSELSALKDWLQTREKLQANEEVIARYLWDGLYDIDQQSFYSQIQQLRPAHYLTIEWPSGKQHEDSYWQLPATHDIVPFDPQGFRTLFDESVRLQLQSDVPVGTCLSGGLDSSSIFKSIQQQSNHQWAQATFSACFDDPRFDERPFIEHVLHGHHTKSHQVFPSPKTLQQDLSDLIHHQGEPFGSLSIFAQWEVMKQAQAAGIKVLLDGQGADELLAGYGYNALFWRDLALSGNWDSLKQEMAASPNHRQWMNNSARALGFAPLQKSLQALFLIKPRPLTQEQRYGHHPVPNSALRRELLSLLHLRLPALLRHEDRNSMAFSIEARVPFLDHRLAEFLWKQHSSSLIHKGWSKWILRYALQDLLPSEICWRKDKMGFVTPQQLWLQRELAPLCQSIFDSSSFQERSWWRASSIQKLYHQYQLKPSAFYSQVLWRILNLEIWAKQESL